MAVSKKGILLYYTRDDEKITQIKAIGTGMQLQTKQLKTSDLNIQTGRLAGIKNIAAREPAEKTPAIFCMPEVIIFSGLSDKELDDFLTAYHNTGLAPVKLKAVITPTNAGWTLYRLIRELSSESEQIEKSLKK